MNLVFDIRPFLSGAAAVASACNACGSRRPLAKGLIPIISSALRTRSASIPGDKNRDMYLRYVSLFFYLG